ncbi:MAG: AAA family ATPase, partial [Bacillota bacterium]
MPRVTLKRMIVRGFGPYADEAVVDLLPEANVLVAPNESGKSTLAAALAAILYGLPATADPERFGQGRYRHWGQAPRFEGELLLTVDGSDYHLTRQFETHKVSLRRRDGERWRLLIDGVADNPESKKPNPHYRRFLQETIGLENRELFEATFCLAQPLPNEVELDDAVQQLLSGTGNRYSQVSKALEAKIKELTRYYGLALGDKSKGNKDRQLEQVENEICDLEQKIAS